mmetsp:Transcript_39509/g.92453  ORF Transcript_39509/g.92453 Transcript_39509/m.92453 type:complete len:208 (-) Transcript_39509:972-1595(-)
MSAAMLARSSGALGMSIEMSARSRNTSQKPFAASSGMRMAWSTREPNILAIRVHSLGEASSAISRPRRTTSSSRTALGYVPRPWSSIMHSTASVTSWQQRNSSRINPTLFLASSSSSGPCLTGVAGTIMSSPLLSSSSSSSSPLSSSSSTIILPPSAPSSPSTLYSTSAIFPSASSPSIAPCIALTISSIMLCGFPSSPKFPSIRIT